MNSSMSVSNNASPTVINIDSNSVGETRKSAGSATPSSTQRVNDTEKVEHISDHQSDGQVFAEAGKSPPPNQQATASEGDSNRLEQAVEDLNRYVQSIQRDLQFTIDDETDKTIITVKDSLTDETIRQIPTEQAIEMAHKLQDLGDNNSTLIETLV